MGEFTCVYLLAENWMEKALSFLEVSGHVSEKFELKIRKFVPKEDDTNPYKVLMHFTVICVV